MSETGPPHLDRKLGERRLELGIKWRELAERAGMTAFHLQRIRSGRTVLSEDAAAGIDRAAEWERGSTERVYAGGEPTMPRRDQSAPDSTRTMLDELGINLRKWQRVPQSTRDAITTAYRVDRERRSPEAQRANGA